MLTKDGKLLIAKNDHAELSILPNMLNRHGLITGATGTGKTVSLQVIAESISAQGVPVFMTDIKGDVSGISKTGSKDNAKVQQRVDGMKLADAGFTFQGCPTVFWDIFAKDGHPLRATISEMGPLLLSRILDLNDTQTEVMQVIFRIADDNGLLLLDLKDMRKMAEFVAEKRADFSKTYGNIAPATLGSIQRGLLGLDTQGGNNFFGEPALGVFDLMQTRNGKGVINIMAADQLMQSPRIYASFLLWLLSELYEGLPEVGDLPQPKLVLFFDEAHLLFTNAPKALLEKIEQVVRLIRSKAVGVYFITQNPADIPEMVLAQLGNRIQHALRAYTPREQQAVRAAAGAFRPNPAFKTEDAIGNLGVGEALLSLLDNKGIPAVVERCSMLPPESQIGPVTPAERADIIKASPLAGKYDTMVDRESAYEKLSARVMETPAETGKKGAAAKKGDEGIMGEIFSDFTKKMGQSMTRVVATQVSRSLLRGVLGSLFGGKK